MEIYSYQPLPTPTSIRLIQVGEKDESGLFHCFLKTVDLKDSPWYHAFSYTWGNPHAEAKENHAFTKNFEALNPEYTFEGRRPILCDGKLLYINRNLYDAFCDVPKHAWRKFINQKKEPEGWSRLHVSVIAGEHEQVRQLLRSGIDLNIVDKNGDTAINWAARMGKSEMVTLLVEAGAKIDISNNYSETALDGARKYQHAEIVMYLEGIVGKSEAPFPLEPMGDGPEIWAWIDQVCINQEDLEERSSQVGIMDQIYQKSAFTITWLGREDRYTKKAASVIAKLYPTMDRFVNSDIMPYSDEHEDAYRKAGIPYISKMGWDSLAALFQRQYFRRLWIVQEQVLSNVVLIYCGSVEIPWKHLGVAAQLLDQRQDKIGGDISSKYVPLNEAARRIESSVLMLVYWKDTWMHGPEANRPRELNLENLIFDTWHFRATDPRDKIYGLFGLLSLKDTAYRDWKVDYKKPAVRVYAEATKRIISDAGKLKVLSTVIDHSHHKLSSLPSWVPDYSIPFTHATFMLDNAAGRLPIPSPILSPSGAWNELRVRGAQIGTVLRTGSTTEGPGDVRALFHPSWLELTLLIPSKYHHTSESRTEALWRTLCGNKDIKGFSPAPAHYRNDFYDMISRMVVRTGWIEALFTTEYPECQLSPSLRYAVEKNLTAWSKQPLSDMTVESWERSFSIVENTFFDENHQSLIYTLCKLHLLSMTEGYKACTPTLEHLLEVEKTLFDDEDPATFLSSTDGKSSDFVRAFRTRVGRMRLFVTENRFIGLGPAAMKEGDGVWVLPGAGAMFILRKLGGAKDSKGDDQTADNQKDDDQRGDDKKDDDQENNDQMNDKVKNDDCKDNDQNDDCKDDDGGMRYIYIGEAYLHGCMNGEAVDGKKVKLENVILV